MFLLTPKLTQAQAGGPWKVPGVEIVLRTSISCRMCQAFAARNKLPSYSVAMSRASSAFSPDSALRTLRMSGSSSLPRFLVLTDSSRKTLLFRNGLIVGLRLRVTDCKNPRQDESYRQNEPMNIGRPNLLTELWLYLI
jgi:hypothetical protein